MLKLFIQLLSEIPSETVVLHTMGVDTYTASEMIKEMQSGSEIGVQYVSDFSRVVRDFLGQQAKK